jgi:hypothetical protein
MYRHEGHLMQHKTDGMLIIETEGGILFRTSTPFATQTSRYALEHRETTYPVSTCDNVKLLLETRAHTGQGGVGFEKLHITAPFAPHLVQSLCTFWISRSLKVSVDRILDFAIPSPQLEAYIRPTTNYLCSLLDLIRIGHWADDTAFISSVHAGLRYYLIKGKHTLAELILSLEKIYVGEHKDEECFHTARSILLTRLLKDQNAIMDNGPLHTKLKHLTSLSKELNDNLSLGTTYWHECWRPDEKPASLQDSQMYLYMRPTLGRQVVYILDFQMQKTAPM